MALASVKKGIGFAGLLRAAHNALRVLPALWPPATWSLFGKVMVYAYVAAGANPSLEGAKVIWKTWRLVQADVEVFFAISGEVPDAVPLGLIRTREYFPVSGHDHIRS